MKIEFGFAILNKFFRATRSLHYLTILTKMIILNGATNACLVIVYKHEQGSDINKNDKFIFTKLFMVTNS